MRKTISIWKRIWRYGLDHVGLLLALFLGCALGLFIRLPFFPWVLPPDASNVIGAALGALIGVGAAAVIANAVVHRGDARSAGTVAAAIMTPTLSIKAFVAAAPTETIGIDFLYAVARSLRTDISRATARLQTLERVSMYAVAGLQIADAKLAFKQVHSALDGLMPLIRDFMLTRRGTAGPDARKRLSDEIADRMRSPITQLQCALWELGAAIPADLDRMVSGEKPDAGSSSLRPPADAPDLDAVTPPAAP